MNHKLPMCELLYLMRFLENYIEECVSGVLEDSPDDPHYSAVTATNMIVCYIEAMKAFKKPAPYKNLKEYFLYNHFSEIEFLKFENSRKTESAYYVGEQWNIAEDVE